MWRTWWSSRPETPSPEPTAEGSSGVLSPPTADSPRGPTTRGEPTDDELIERIARAIVERGLATPALFVLESSKPLSFVASQGLVFLGPFVDAAFSVPEYEAFTRLIEDRANVDELIQRIEALDLEQDERRRREREAARRAKEDRQHGVKGA